jgi:hypothetical protein
VWQRISYAPTGTIVRGTQDLARELLAIWRALWVGQESAAVVVDDVVLVLAGLANSSIGDGEDIIVVHVVVLGVSVRNALRIGRRRVHTTCEPWYHWPSCHPTKTYERSA